MRRPTASPPSAVVLLAAGMCVAGFLSAVPLHPERTPQADLVFFSGHIHTMDSALPEAEALAIRDGVILAVGSNLEIARTVGPQTQRIDLGGRMVLPGFIDSHIHFLEGSLALEQLNLDGAYSLAEIQQRLRDYVRAHPGQGWILGRGWLYSAFAPSGLPHKKYIDEIVADRPVLLEAYDGHTVWVNSRALQLSGITSKTADPRDGTVVRDEQGKPTGALKEGAQALVRKAIPEPSRAEKLRALRQGLAEANRFGLTSVVNASSSPGELELYQELERRGELTLRTYTALNLRPGITRKELDQFERVRRRYRSPWVRAGLIKGFVDGVIESHTAAMLEPYADDPTQRGALNYLPEELTRLVRELDQRDFQVMLHAIGDRGVRVALDAYQATLQSNGKRDRRFRLEHIETISPADIPRLGQLGVVASFQPYHCYPEPNLENVWARNVGPQRLTWAFAWRDVSQAGARLAFGSDWPVVTVSPLVGMQNAVTRQDNEGQPAGGWVGHQKVTLEEALAAYTINGAYAQFQERLQGSLKPSKWADLVVLSRNLFEVPSQKIHTVEVLMTVVNGKIVHRSSNW